MRFTTISGLPTLEIPGAVHPRSTIDRTWTAIYRPLRAIYPVSIASGRGQIVF